MSASSSEATAPPPPHLYFVDEAGDGVIFDGKGQVLVGTGKVQDYFTVGMVECRTLKALTEDFAALRAQLLTDPYFRGVPSMQPDAQKTALFFHAKDDLPEVRREVFKVLERHDFSFYAVVRTMSAVVRRVKERNERDPTYRYRPTELYDSAVRRLFDRKLHTRPAFAVVFASRGKARTQALREHLLNAQAASRKAAGTYPNAISRPDLAQSRAHRGCRRYLREALRHLPHPQTHSAGRAKNKKSEGRGLSGEPTITRHGAEFHLPMPRRDRNPTRIAKLIY